MIKNIKIFDHYSTNNKLLYNRRHSDNGEL